MLDEIAPAIPWQVKKETAEEFGKKVLDRFRNPYINHQWLSISMQYTSKMKMRNVPVMVKYWELFNAVPENMALGFAAYLLFMRPLQKQQDRYYGEQAGKTYLLQDDYAGYFYEKWSTFKPAALAAEVLSDISLWGEDLSAIPGFTESVAEKMNMISEEGVVQTLQRRLSQKAVI
jgi:tagaturonate reductase